MVPTVFRTRTYRLLPPLGVLMHPVIPSNLNSRRCWPYLVLLYPSTAILSCSSNCFPCLSKSSDNKYSAFSAESTGASHSTMSLKQVFLLSGLGILYYSQLSNSGVKLRMELLCNQLASLLSNISGMQMSSLTATTKILGLYCGTHLLASSLRTPTLYPRLTSS